MVNFNFKGINLSLKDDIKEVKQELGAQEQFLENVIKSELFLTKHKKTIIIFLTIIICAFVGNYAVKSIKENSIENANILYSKLLKNPKDTKTIEELKKENVNLYALFELNNAGENNNTSKLKEVLALNGLDPILKDVINYKLGLNSGEIMSTYSSLVKGFKLLEKNDLVGANNEFAKIPLTSPLNAIAKNLQHYHGNKK